ncbi:MAG: hypothetical protein FWD57_11530 [Polyangiaceae bacterium]|nr:hypothetical protein [Polyangiaceae bacterium]
MMKGWIVAVLATAISVATIAGTRPTLWSTANKVKESSNVYPLPPPNVLVAASFGYRAALADYLWAHVLVTQGLRMSEKRAFSELPQYYEAINALDPRFREPYRLADSLLTLQINDPDRAASAREARRVLERGIAEFPYDSELHLIYGQFLAYLGPGDLPEGSDEVAQWQAAGAQALIRAGELSSDEATAFKAISAASMLVRQGEQDAAISFLERLYMVADDEEVREDVGRRLSNLRMGKQASLDYELSKEFDSLWRSELPFAPRAWLSLLGPPRDGWKCSGPMSSGPMSSGPMSSGPMSNSRDSTCFVDWQSWSRHALRQRGATE